MAIVSADPLVAAALRARLASAADLWVVADPSHAAVIIWDPPSHPAADELPTLPFEPDPSGGSEPAAIVALVAETTAPMPLLAAGVRGLLSRDADSDRLHAAILATARGLTVLDEDPADAIVAAWSPPSEPEPRPEIDRLTPREHDVLALLADGLSNRAIGEELGISAHTVKFHVDALLDKLTARSRTQAVVKAIRQGLLAWS
ncbi:response regulator transcription factor [Enhygromyxa salina]|uniref:response regulator transcription factor n=1 Tax=Enhygromyxa salina TaxID=215803 RepID=UPI0015E6050B|nr:response regulator transcription factor [Enhygromyxa salina]